MSAESSYRFVDSHMHVFPWGMLKPDTLELFKEGKKDFEKILDLPNNPAALVEILDQANVEKAFIIGYTSPDVMGLTEEVNRFVSKFCAQYRDRLVPFGSVHPRFTENVRKEMNYLINDLNIKGIKIHPCHQLVYPNEYRNGKLQSLETIYSTAQETETVVMIHTGTSIFPRARNQYADPIYVDDVAVDFPDLKIILAHGGRPVWMETAFFLVRRHKNVYMDISGIPPANLLRYFPRIEMLAEKTMFGSDWAGPMVPGVKENIEAFLALPISDKAKRQILRETAMKFLER